MPGHGSLIGDSLRPEADLRVENDWRITRVWRIDQGDSAAPGQPREWTVIDFEVEDNAVDAFSNLVARNLKREGGWYCDFRTGDDHVVIFAGKAFRYRRGDKEGRAMAARYGESVGCPSQQLDWPD